MQSGEIASIHNVVLSENEKLSGVVTDLTIDMPPACEIIMYWSIKLAVIADNTDVAPNKMIVHDTIHSFRFILLNGKLDKVKAVSNCNTK